MWIVRKPGKGNANQKSTEESRKIKENQLLSHRWLCKRAVKKTGIKIVNKSLKTVGITLFGLGTSILTAVVLFLLEQYAHFAIYTFMLWYVVPIGAIAAGFVAAIGYYAGARVFQYRPDRLLRINIVIVSILTFIVLNFLLYANMEVDGKRIQDLVSFPQFLHIAITNMTMSTGHSYDSKGFELGQLGYGVAALQVVGFAFGGLLVYNMLEALSYCDRCQRYLHTIGQQVRFADDTEEFRASMQEVNQKVEGLQLSAAISQQRLIGSDREAPTHLLRSTLKLENCKQCGQHWLSHHGEIKTKSGRDVLWNTIEGLKARNVTDSTLTF